MSTLVKIIDILIEMLKEHCPHSLKNEYNYKNLYNEHLYIYDVYCHIEINDKNIKENILCNSCREIIDINLSKSILIKALLLIEQNK